MILNYLKQSVRILNKDRFHSFLNILGLALGLCCSILVLLFIQNELSYDTHHENINRVYRYGVNMTIGEVNSTQATCSIAAGPLLQDEIPEIEAYVRCINPGNLLVKMADRSFYENNLLMVDSSIFQVFTHKFLYGNSEDALQRPNTIILTEDMAKKYFGNSNPVGQELEIENQDIYEITGVIENLPDNSHLQFTALISLNSFLQHQNTEEMYSPRALGSGMSFLLYLLFSENFTQEQFQTKFQHYYQQEMAELDQINYVAVVEALKDIHLFSTINKRLADSNRRFLFGFASLGLFIIILACINYTNMATSRAGSRTREIGMKKVLGAHKKQLIIQFLSESIILSFFALIISLLFTELVLKLTPFNQLINKDLQINLAGNPILMPGLLSITFLVGIISGLYPAFYLSKLAPITSLKGEINKGKIGSFFRNALVSFQFIISIAAIILTLLMHQQIDYMMNLDPGFNEENVLIISSSNQEVQNKFQNFRKSIINHHDVVSAGFSSSSIGHGLTGYAFKWEAENGEMEIHATRQLYADLDYLETMGISVVLGSNFTRKRRSDDETINFIVNEAMVDLFNWTNPIGKKNQYGQVIGVVKDFNFSSAQNEIIPLYILQSRRPLGVLNVRLKGENIKETMVFIKQKWQEFSPDIPINYSFLEQDLDNIYSNEETQRKLSSIFTYFCILISCFGLFGLTSYTTVKRTKEVAVRKILGCSIPQIISTLFKSVFKIIVISSVLAVPTAFYIFRYWQNNYVYKVSLDPMIFISAILGALIISAITSVYHTVKVANTNPVKSLKYE